MLNSSRYPPYFEWVGGSMYLSMIVTVLLIAILIGVLYQAGRHRSITAVVLLFLLLGVFVFQAGYYSARRAHDVPAVLILLGAYVGCFAGVFVCIVRLAMSKFSLGASVVTALLAAVIGFGWSDWLAAMQGGLASVERSDCKVRMRKIAIAMHDWHDDHHRLPDLVISDGETPPRSWRVELLPWMDGEGIRRLYDDRYAWNDATNDAVARTHPIWLQCPAVKPAPNLHDESGRYFAHYLAVTGTDTAFPDGRGLSLDAISAADGTSKTFLLVEASGRNVVWTRPVDADVDEQPFGINLLGASPYQSPGILSSYHFAGPTVALVDGSTYTIRPDMDPKLLKALTTVHGNDPAERGF